MLAELDSAEDEMLDESELIAAANAAARQVSGKPGSKRKAKEQLKDKTKVSICSGTTRGQTVQQKTFCL